MNRRRLFFICAGLCTAMLATPSTARPVPGETLRVVATIPDLADIAREIGGDRVEVTALTKGRENLHHVSVRPSHLIALSRADVLIQIGLSLESAFLPALLENAGNPKIRPGRPGFVNASVGWQAIDVPTVVTRKDGDVHPDGNPHLNLDPRGGRQIAERTLAGLVATDPSGKTDYEAWAAAYAKKLDAAEARWNAAAKDWKGRKIVVYHKEYDYLAARYGLEIVGTLETKPGIPPTPGHLAELVAKMKSAASVVILTAPWSNGGEVEQVAKATGAAVVELPNQCGGMAGAETWIGMQDLIHERLGRAFGTNTGTK